MVGNNKNINNDIDISNLKLSADREKNIKSRVINHFVIIPMSQHLSNKKNYGRDFKDVQAEVTKEEKKFKWLERKVNSTEDNNKIKQSVDKTKVFVLTVVIIFVGMILFSIVFWSLRSSNNSLNLTEKNINEGNSVLNTAQSSLMQTLHTGNIFFGIIIFSFFIILVVGLFTRINSKNNKTLQKKAKTMLIIGVVGLLIAMFSFVLFTVSLNNSIKIENNNPDRQWGVTTSAKKGETAILMDINPAVGAAPFVVNFRVDDSYIKEGRFYKWEFGDRQMGNGQEVKHIYDKIGDFTVILTVTDSQGMQKSYKETVSINNIKPEIKAFADVVYGEAPLHVNLNAQKSKDPNGFITNYQWTFPDTGEIKIGDVVSHTFNKPGIHKVEIKVTDNNNDYSVAIIEVEVLEKELPLPIIETTPKKLSGEVPFEVVFNAYRSQAIEGNIINYIWNFGDGSPIQNWMKVEHTFTDAGIFKVKLTIEDNNWLKNFQEIEVIIEKKNLIPEWKIKVNGQLLINSMLKRGISGDIPFSVEVDGGESIDYDGNIIGYEWIFGDNSLPVRVQKTTHTYDKVGEYLLTLNVTDNVGDTNTKTLKIITQEKDKEPPIIDLVTIPESQSIQVGEEMLFDASHSYDPNGWDIISFNWDFGDRISILSWAQVKHKYEKTGIYEVKVKALNNIWLESIYKLKIAVTDIIVVAKINVDKSKGIKPLTVFFDASLSSGGIVDYIWDFGDGIISNKIKTTHTYTEEGVYTVKLKVIDSNWLINEEEIVIVVQG